MHDTLLSGSQAIIQLFSFLLVISSICKVLKSKGISLQWLLVYLVFWNISIVFYMRSQGFPGCDRTSVSLKYRKQVQKFLTKPVSFLFLTSKPVLSLVSGQLCCSTILILRASLVPGFSEIFNLEPFQVICYFTLYLFFLSN